MTAFRLPAPLHPDAPVGRSVSFMHDGRRIQGHDTEPVAVSLLVAGVPVLSRSFRFHRPRGLMCATGQCGWCECRVDGQPGTRSCIVPVVEGMQVHSEHSWPNARHDVFGLLDVGSRFVPNTFYHHRFLRPRALRKLYLDVLRRFGGRGRLTPGGVGPILARPAVHRAVDVAVVGGGPAGMLAALGAAEAGGGVILIDEAEALGGSWRWRRPSADGALSSLVGRVVKDRRIEVLTGTRVLGLYGETLAAIGAGAHWLIAARSVVTAAGSYERVPRVQNNDRPGVMGARTVEWLINAFGVVPGRRSVVLKGGADADRVTDLLRRAGAEVESNVEDLLEIGGRDRVRSVVVGHGDRRRGIDTEIVVFDARTPSLDLALAAGAAIDAVAEGHLTPRLDDDGWTSVPGVAMAGACAGRPIDDDEAAALATRTGHAAGRSQRAMSPAGRGEAPRAAWPSAVRPAESMGASAFVCFCEDVRARELDDELRADASDPEILKRRTAVLTGPCQGKYCLPAFAAAVNGRHWPPPGWHLPTGRPPLRPVRIGDLVRDGSPDTDR